jgi:hypothetical protein
MPLIRADYDQAARYLSYALNLMQQQAPGKHPGIREVLGLAIRRLSPGDNFVGRAAAEITVMRQAADKVPISAARTEILKAVVVLRDRGG